jgi:acyl-CoA thioesterase-2
LGGNLDLPITYEVDIIRDGKSFTTRRVVAFQEGRAIFNMSASFQLVQSGVDHQFSMPNYIPPEKLLSDLEQLEVQNTDPEAYNRFKKIKPEVIEFRPVEKLTLRDDVNAPAESNYWFRSKESTPFGLDLQHQLLAYISDYGLLRTATLPHKKELGQGPTFYTSIDHAIWFHRPFSLEEWLLYAMDSPSASSSRGFSRGTIFDREGLLVASTAQEGLIRQLSQ